MPQPDSSPDRVIDSRWNELDATWPMKPVAPRQSAVRSPARPAQRPPEKPDQDGRTPDDRDGNEEQKREKEKPSSGRVQTDRQGREGASCRRDDPETDDTGEWVATQTFTIDDELEDTLPNVPMRYLE